MFYGFNDLKLNIVVVAKVSAFPIDNLNMMGLLYELDF